MKNGLSDLHNILMEQVEKLAYESDTDEQFKKNKDKAMAIANIGKVIVDEANLVLQAEKFRKEIFDPNNEYKLPKLLG